MYLVNKKICSVLTKEKVDCSTKKIFFVKKVAKFVHKILLKKLGFVFYGILGNRFVSCVVDDP